MGKLSAWAIPGPLLRYFERAPMFLSIWAGWELDYTVKCPYLTSYTYILLEIQ